MGRFGESYFYRALPVSKLVDYGNISTNIVYILLIALFFFISSFWVSNKKERIYYNLVVFGFFFLKIGCIYVNEYVGLFAPKVAGNFTIWYYVILKNDGISNFLSYGYNSTFYPQLLLNYIPFDLFGATRLNLLTTNSLFTSFAGIAGYFTFKKYYGSTTGLLVLFLLGLYPASINFSFFGLRDPIIYMFVVINVCVYFHLFKGKDYKHILSFFITSGILLLARPELAAFLFTPYFTLFFIRLVRGFRSIQNINIKTIAFFSILLFFVIPSIGIGIFGFRYVAKQVGAVNTLSPIEIVTTFAEYRYLRDVGTGEDIQSHIVPANLYKVLPWYARWSLQTLGIIIIPFPWLITSVAKVLAFMDSIFIMYLIRQYFKGVYLVSVEDRLMLKSLFYAFVIGIIIMGTIVINAGNAFRMRISIAPYIIIVSAIIIGLALEAARKKENYN